MSKIQTVTGSQPASASMAPVTKAWKAKLDRGVLKEQFDFNLHKRMNLAQTAEDWTGIAHTIVGAHTHGTLCGEHLDHFFRYCTEQSQKDYVRGEVGVGNSFVIKEIEATRAKYAAKWGYSLGGNTLENVLPTTNGSGKKRAMAEARRAANRAERHAKQPAPAKSGGGGDNNHGKDKGKKGKSKKK